MSSLSPGVFKFELCTVSPHVREPHIHRLNQPCIWRTISFYGMFQVVLVVKNVPSNAGGVRGRYWIQSLGQEYPLEESTSNPLHYSCLENSMDRGAWRPIVHSITKSRTQLKRLACMHIILYKGLRHPHSLVSVGVLEPIP